MFCRNVFPVYKTFFFYLSYSITSKYFVFPVLPFKQWKVAVLSGHAYTSLILNLVRLHSTFPAKFEGMCAAVSSLRGIDIFFLANRDLLVIRLLANCLSYSAYSIYTGITKKMDIDFNYRFIFNGDGFRYLYFYFKVCNPF